MKKLRLFIFAFVILNITHLTSQAQRIYLTDSIPKPDVKVFITNDSLTADLKICLVDSLQKVKRDGLWFMVNQVQQSNLIVKVETNPLKANIRIYYVQNPRQAGWIDSNKRFYYHHKN